MIVRQLKGLTDIIPVSVVHWQNDEGGWRFYDPEIDGKAKGDEFGTIDHVYGYKRAKQLYLQADPNFQGKITVPVLWDKELKTIVNNESSEIIRMFNSAFNSLILDQYKSVDFYPEPLRPKIDELNDWIYDNINNGVYKTGFATTEEEYTKQCLNVFKYLDKLEEHLAKNHAENKEFLIDNTLTEADIRLFTTIIRFDVVYVQHFKCNIRMIRHDYPHIHKWLRLLYWKIPGFKDTTDFDHIKKHYTKTHKQINPLAITPVGPLPNILPL